MKLIICNSVPLQVELQPGKGCGGYNCKFCYGYNQELIDEEELTIEDYYKLVDELEGKVKFITMAGIKSEPLTNKNIYNIIKKIKENGLRLGIHTKGFLLNPHISDLLNTNTAFGDFVTITIDASEELIYNRLHGLPNRARFFDTVKKNVQYLYEQKMSTKSDLNINVSYLLFKDNSSREQMEKFVLTFADFCNVIRFSPPQLPNKVDKKPYYYLDSLEEVRKIVKHLKEKYPDKNIIFLDFKDHSHNTDFKYCYAQRFLAVIDPHGYVYPCPQITTLKFKPITYGYIKDRAFWEIWNSDNRKRIMNMEVEKMGCRICDRKDEALNIELNKIFNNEKIG